MAGSARYAKCCAVDVRGNRRAASARRGPPTPSLWGAGVVHHLPEVVDATRRRAAAAKERIREPQELSVLVELAEVVHGVAGDVVAECPRTRRAVAVRGAEERVEVGGHPVVGKRRLDAAVARAAVAAVDRADVRRLDPWQVGLERDAAVVDVEARAGARAREDDRRRMVWGAVRPDVQVRNAIEA